MTGGDPLILGLLPRDKALELRALPLFLVGEQLTVAVADPSDLTRLDNLAFITSKTILPALALPSALDRRLTESYGAADEVTDPQLVFLEESESGSSDAEILEGLSIDDERPIVRLVNLILVRAISQRATDVHLEPQRSSLKIRFRVDGRLQDLPFQISPALSPNVISRIKVLAGMDIAAQFMPQDGKIRISWNARQIDLRVSSIPSVHGEKVVLRLLDRELNDFNLGNIGMSDEVCRLWTRLLNRREGMLLVSGPTGSGKSSTLYASLREVMEPDVNVVTLEDPVEYDVADATQIQIHEKRGLTFAEGLRSVLRQDPDIIMVGEIRDTESAVIAARAALTGHLVLASLHASDAPSAVSRLLELGVPGHLLSSSLLGVLSQRLVRLSCESCTHELMPTEFGAGVDHPLRADKSSRGFVSEGCDACDGIGFAGRTGVHELMEVTRGLRSLISKDAPLEELEASARLNGYQPMWWQGVELARAGRTTVRELRREIREDDLAEPVEWAPDMDREAEQR